MTLPLDGQAIKATVERISRWTGLNVELSIDFGPLDPSISSPLPTRETFLQDLENMDDEPFPMRTFADLMFLP
jgi:hypothetical protein